MSKWTMIYDECYQEIIQEIKKTREERYTQREFSKKLGMSQKTISCYENCRSEMNIKLLIEICQILDINFMRIIEIFFKTYAKKGKIAIKK